MLLLFLCLGVGEGCMDQLLWQRNVFMHAYTTLKCTRKTHLCVCLCASMCVRERERQKESVSDKDLIQHDLTVSLCVAGLTPKLHSFVTSNLANHIVF